MSTSHFTDYELREMVKNTPPGKIEKPYQLHGSAAPSTKHRVTVFGDKKEGDNHEGENHDNK